MNFLRWFISFCLLSSVVNPVYAIPPPETLALLGGGIVYPGLLLIGIFTVLLKYIWVKTKLYLVWRMYLARVFSVLLILFFCLKIPFSNQWWAHNHPVSVQTIEYWQQSDSKPVFIDLRDTDSYSKAHLVGSINFPFGEGLTTYLKKNHDTRIILYCELGLRSAGPRWLEADMSLLEQALDENRLFYFPGGFHALMKLGDKTPVPIIINIPSVYANYLLKNPNFTEIKFSDAHASSQLLSDYEKITAKHGTPIINSVISGDLIADKLSQLKAPKPASGQQHQITTQDPSSAPTPSRGQALRAPSTPPRGEGGIERGSYSEAPHLFLTTLTPIEPYPLNSLVLIIFLLSVTLFILRRRELFRSLFTQPSAAYKWINVLISIMMSVVVIRLSFFTLPIPFDYFLYVNVTDLPINSGYLFLMYTFFGLIFFAHLVYPSKKRLNFLHQKLNSVFVPTKYIRVFKLPTWRELFIVGGILSVLYTFSCPLSTIFLLSLFLLVPIFVDLLLYSLIRQFKNIPMHVLNLLEQCGYVCNPAGDTFVQLNTQDELALARIKATIGKETVSLGLFSGDLLDDNKGVDDNKGDQLARFTKKYDLQEATLRSYSGIVRHLLGFFQQDLELHLDSDMNIISLRFYQNYANTRIINRHVLLKHYQILPGKINERRFTSSLFQDVFANPNPLTLDVLKLRWDKKGGCLKALHKLGLLIKYNDKTHEQFVVFSNHIYIDETFEKAIFSANRLYLWLRSKVLQITFNLGTDSVFQDYYTLILPRTQLRLTKLTEDLQKSLSERQLKRVINRALTVLCKESAMWQCYSSLLHQHSFNQLQIEAEKSSSDLSDLINQPLQVLSSLPSYYELSSESGLLDSEVELKQCSGCSYYRNAFLKTETVRTDIRQLQLKEWQLISLLLEKLREKLKLPMSLVYLTKDDFCFLPSKRTKLIDLLNYRYEVWKTQNQWHFPSSFSLQDMEQLSLNSVELQDASFIESHAIRVAGNQQIITGKAVIFQDNLMIDTLPKGSILIADNLLPDQVIACQHINGIILKKGGYLSHTSIIAREKNIPMIAQFKISDIKDNDKLMIQSGNQVTVLSNKVIEWEFLDPTATATDMGNKAHRLAMMSQKGFNLPTTLILKHNSIEKIHQLVSSEVIHDAPSQLWQVYHEELKQILNQLMLKKSSIIVRSSTNAEDSSDYSYAGIFYSQPNISTTEELVSAICAAWQNVVDRAKTIQQYSGETQLALNLILQPYIKGQFGGVLFTESATPGLMHVEIAPGGVEGVTEGNAELTSLFIDERGQTFQAIGEKNSLSEHEYQRLYHLGREIEALFGKPQDIEWILAEQQFYVIQSRDIILRAVPI